jgi:diguanylate cyclase (GGDEF)-like protein/PAS domain S-box-containing protein
MPRKTMSQLNEENLALQARLTRMATELAEKRGEEGVPHESLASERRRVERALKASEVRYRRLFESAKDGILILDAESGTIMDSNPFLEQMLEYTHAELQGKQLWEIGPFSDTAASQISFQELQSNEYIRYDDLPLETKAGQIRQVEFISNLYLVDTVRVIQCNVRDITARKLAEARVQQANEALSSLVAVLQRRDSEFTGLAHMNDLLQTCETQDEAYRIIALKAGELFAGRSGCLAVSHPSGRYLETVARWGDDMIVEDVFPMVDCWALRRGRPHEVDDPRTSLLCTHFVRPPSRGYRCLPLMVQGETLGVLYLDAASQPDHRSGQHQLALAAGEAIKLSLANLRLRKKLHEQATRDPLTGLFNRRYFEETLPRELHRTLRRNAPLCIAMLDLDHFKQFNDTFGHEAGDLVLREASRLLRDGLRKSDIPCRYGGEEFVLVLPDSSLEDTINRLEQTRRQLEGMDIRHNGQLLATMTFSAGVAASPIHGSSPEDLLRGADAALYAAKHAGRNRIVAFGGATPDAAKAAGA